MTASVHADKTSKTKPAHITNVIQHQPTPASVNPLSPSLARAFDSGRLNGAQRVNFVQQAGHQLGNKQVQRMLSTRQNLTAAKKRPARQIQRACACGGEEAEQQKLAPVVARQEEPKTVQRACACGGTTTGAEKAEEGVQRAPAATPTEADAKAEFDKLFSAVDAFLSQSQGNSSSLVGSPGSNLVGDDAPTGSPFGPLKREGDKLVDRGTPNWVVSYKPQALLKPLGNAGAVQQRDFATDPNHDSFNVVRGNNGTLTISTDIHWERTSQNGSKGGGGGGGGGPTGILGTLCDAGKIATFLIPGVGKVVQALCAAGDPKKRADIIDKLTNAELCALAALLGAVVGVGLGGIIGGGLCLLVIPFVGDTLRNKLKELLGATPGDKPPTPNPVTVTDKGDARAVLDTRFVFTADGQLQLLGTPPTGQSRGKAGELANPVAFSRDTSTAGALISIVPLLHSSVNSTRENGETISDINDFQQTFAIDLIVPPPPAPVAFCCTKQLFPFVVAKDRFEREDDKQQELFDWFEALSPQVRKSVQDKQTRVTVIGRASNTGSKAFNLDLAERRAKHVSKMMSDFGGTDARIDAFAFGRLTAKASGEAGFERRAEVLVKGEIPGNDPAVPNAVPPCGTNVPDEGGVCADPAAL